MEGALLFRLVQTDRVGPGRADWIADWFTNLRRLSDEQWEDLDLVSLLIDRDFVRDVRERNRKLRVGCLALVEDLDAFDITVRDTFNLATEQKALRYRIGLKAGAITKDLIMKAVHALDAALVDIALLPESTLDDRVCQLWIDVVRTHRPDPGNPLRWIVAGTGHMADGLRRRNTAVVIHRQSGIELARQDKTARYTIPQGTATKWGMDTLTGADEYWEDIEPGTTVVGLESEAGRIAVVICESLSRPVPETDRLHRLGVTHILVPVLDRELGDDRWEVHYSRERVRDIGCSIVIANSLAIARRRQARLIEGAPPPGSIVCSMSRTSTSSYQLKTAEGCLDVQIHEV
ncbi:MAG TPA: hypothetical protein VJA46_05905 [Acidimicrobiia bacterium]|nr:hypothetical protein [Acidimicrobiia bacterium]